MTKAGILAIILVLLLPLAVFAQGELAVTQQALYIHQDNYGGYFFARVENIGDKPIGLLQSTFSLTDESGKLLYEAGNVQPVTPYILLAPFEYVYLYVPLFDADLTVPGQKVASLVPVERNIGTTYLQLESLASFHLAGGNSVDNHLYVTFTNTTDEPLSGFLVSAALLDSEDNLLYVYQTAVRTIALHPGSTITVDLPIPKKLVADHEHFDRQPAKAEALVYYQGE